MNTVSRMGRALLVVSALSLPALASAQSPASNKPPATKKVEGAQKHAVKHDAAKVHKPAEAKPKAK